MTVEEYVTFETRWATALDVCRLRGYEVVEHPRTYVDSNSYHTMTEAKADVMFTVRGIRGTKTAYKTYVELDALLRWLNKTGGEDES